MTHEKSKDNLALIETAKSMTYGLSIEEQNPSQYLTLGQDIIIFQFTQI